MHNRATIPDFEIVSDDLSDNPGTPANTPTASTDPQHDQSKHVNVDVVEEGGVSPLLLRVFEGVLTGVATGLTINALRDGNLADRIYTTRQTQSMKGQFLRLGAYWNWLPLKQTDRVLFWGPKFGGKSTTAYKLIHDLAKDGPGLIISAEEDPTNGSAKRKGSVVRRSSDNVMVVNTKDIREAFEVMITPTRDGKQPLFKYILIDSATALWPKDSAPFLYMMKESFFKNTLIIIVVQATKLAQNYKGGADLGHQVDVEVKIDKGMADVLKNRNGVAGEYQLFAWQQPGEDSLKGLRRRR